VRTLVAALVVAGCAHPAARKIEMDPIVFVARPSGKVETVDAASLFADAGAAFADKRFDEAARRYDQLATEMGESRFVNASLYNGGLAREAVGDLAGAADRYRHLVARGEVACKPRCTDVLDALFRLGGVYGQQKNWAAAAEVFAQVLAEKSTSVSDRVEALARRGEAQLNLGDLGACERTLRDQKALVQGSASVERLDSDFFVAMGAFYLGEVAHQQYRLLPVRLPEKQLADDLEAKARMLLSAQARYIEAMKVNNPEWATAAGFQIGTLYREFYDDLVGAPVPPQLTGEAREVYLEEVRKQVRSLLTKAVSVHEKNLLMAERIGVQNEWVRRSNEQMEQLKRLLVPGPVGPAEPRPANDPPAPPLPKPRDQTTPRVVM
jgi:tetratricopeptide (TPR) repeat protein